MGEDLELRAGDELVTQVAFLRGVARGLLRQEDEDLVQETLVAALERGPERGVGRGWLVATLRHRASNARRTERRRGEREERAARAESVEPADEALARLEVAQRLADLVLGLREPYRTTIYLRYHAGLGPRAIAARMGVPVKTVKTRLGRALVELRRELEARGGGRERWLPGLVGLAHPGAMPLGGGGLVGGLLMKKHVAALLLVVLAAGLVWQGGRLARLGPGALGRESAAEPLRRPVVVAEESAAPAPPASAPREALPAVSRPSAQVGTLVVRLRRDRDGAPLEGFCVDLRALDDPGPRPERRHALTDAQGRAVFEQVPAGAVRAFAPGGAARTGEVVAGERRELELLQRDTPDLVGQVVDPAGAGVVGAEVWIHGPGDPLASHLALRTGAEGRFVLPGLEDDVQVGARAAGLRPSMLFECGELALGASGAREVRLELRAAGAGLAGRVLDARGTPVNGAWVLAGPSGGTISDLADGRRAYAPGRVVLSTDERGEFSQPGDLDPGSCELFVVAPGAPVWTATVELSAGERTWVDVRLVDGLRVRGRVVDARGRPVAGAEVLATREFGLDDPREWFLTPRTTSDEAGLFLLELVPPGACELRARVPGRDRLGRARAGLDAGPGAELEVELVLDPGSLVTGRVVDRAGVPLVGWGVFAESEWLVEDRAAGLLHGRGLRRTDRTDAEGAFVIANLEPHPLDVAVAAPGEWPHPPRARARGVRPGTGDLVLVVEEARTDPATLAGRLAGLDGRAPRDVRLVLWGAGERSGNFVAFDGASGAFEHAVALPGPYTLEVERAGRTLLTAGPFELVAGARVDVGTLQLGEPGHVEVELLLGPDVPAAHLLLRLSGPGGVDERLELDGARYRSGPLAPGTWSLELHSKGWFAPDVEVSVRGGETARVRLEPRPALPVDLAFEPTDPAAVWSRGWIEIRDTAGNLLRRGGPWSRPTSEARALRFHGLGLPPGHYRAEARTDAGHAGRGDFTLRELDSPGAPLRFPLR